MKEQEKSKKELNEMAAGNLPDTEFKRMAIRMLKGLRKKNKDFSEKYNSMINDTKTIKNRNREYTI